MKPLLFPDNSFSQICRSISMVPERILFQLWLPHLLFSRIHCFFFRPQTKTMNRSFTVYVFGRWDSSVRILTILNSRKEPILVVVSVSASCSCMLRTMHISHLSALVTNTAITQKERARIKVTIGESRGRHAR
jgi:hypothetical protein